MFRIATFNVENLQVDRHLNARLPVLQGVLDRIDADILCLQEVHGNDMPGPEWRVPPRDACAGRSARKDEIQDF